MHEYVVLREPISCSWMTIPTDSHLVRLESCDVFDLMWASRPFSHFSTERDALAVLLLSHGFLHPEVATAREAARLRWLLNDSETSWLKAWLDDSDGGTVVCDGCDECDWGLDTFHRIQRC